MNERDERDEQEGMAFATGPAYERSRVDRIDRAVSAHGEHLIQHDDRIDTLFKVKVSTDSFKPIQTAFYAVLGTIITAAIGLAARFGPMLFGGH